MRHRKLHASVAQHRFYWCDRPIIHCLSPVSYPRFLQFNNYLLSLTDESKSPIHLIVNNMVLIKVVEGSVPFPHPSFPEDSIPQTAYRILGDLSAGKPLVALHGGPGIPHVYLAPLFTYYHKQTRTPVILYDQIGCGKSTHYPEKQGDESFWTVSLFVSELENLLARLGVDKFDLYGHSWGGMLAAVIATESASPVLAPRIEKLILASSPASMKLWETAQRNWLKEMPKAVRQAIEKAEKDGDYESEEYKAAVMEYYKVHMCRIWPFPKALADAFDELEKDPTVYSTMNGPSEITVVGNLKSESCFSAQPPIRRAYSLH